MSVLIKLGPQYFPKSSISTSVGAGSLYIGDVDTDPTIVGNQKTVQALLENGSLQTISQPITLSAGGIPLYNGSPVSIYTSGVYSLAVLDINAAQIYYVPSVPDVVVEGVTALESVTVSDWPGNTNLAQFDGANSIEDSGQSVATIGVLAIAGRWTAQQTFVADALTSTGNSVAWDLNIAQRATHVLTENTTIVPSNMKDGGDHVIRIVQAAGIYTLAWDAAFEWGRFSAPGAPAANGDVIIISFYTDGTTMYGGEFNRVEA